MSNINDLIRIIPSLKCLKCGSKSDIIPYKYQLVEYKTTGAPPIGMTTRKKTTWIYIPLCKNCKKKIGDWVKKQERRTKINGYLGCFSCFFLIAMVLANIFIIELIGFPYGIISLSLAGLILITLLILFIKGRHDWYKFKEKPEKPEHFIRLYSSDPPVKDPESKKWLPYSSWIEQVLNEKSSEKNNLKESNIIICGNCGTKIDNKQDKFCPQCGKKLY